MNLALLDLNLLVTLDALLEEAHVGRAAHRIGLSQPAASHALRRLREILDDPLLVRVGPAMVRTPRAEALRAPLRETLEHVKTLFKNASFDPATSTRSFSIMLPDLAVPLIVPRLLRVLSSAAPSVRLVVQPWQGLRTLGSDFAQEIDLVIACIPDALPGFRRSLLYRDSDALAVRAGHPAGDRLASVEGFCAARHIAVIARGAHEDVLEPTLRGAGLARNVALVVPGYIDALHVASQSDLVAFLPRRLIAAFAGALDLHIIDPPIDPGVDEQYLFYPTRLQNDPASLWIRGLVIDICAGLGMGERLG